MLEKLAMLQANGIIGIQATVNLEQLQEARQMLLGKKGQLTEILKELGHLEPDVRKIVGKKANEVKEAIMAALDIQQTALVDETSAFSGVIDVTRPGSPVLSGGLHPITQMAYDLNDVFLSLGFEVFTEDDITSELYAFDYLNFPPEHPARESMDTYWIAGTEDNRGARRLALRPHLTGASVRYLQKNGAPARFVYPGRAYRNETTDARHERAFYQYEALIVDKDFPFASGQLLVKSILEKVFGQDVDVRMRTGFFPFVEPGFEIDMKCLVCVGVGCKVCKHVGWIEVMPGGTPHPNVLRASGLDPAVWSGFYINIGLDRLCMMRYGVDDVRLFRSADLRFLHQFR